MRIAIASDQDFVSSCFGCTPDCTIVETEAGRIRRTFIVPNPGWSHRSWADFLERNAVACLIVGNIGANARAVLKWRGITVMSGVQGNLEGVVARYCEGTLMGSDGTSPESGCGLSRSECGAPKTT
jgi:predicted Fe-Mo cluster-binding NifX family protein